MNTVISGKRNLVTKKQKYFKIQRIIIEIQLIQKEKKTKAIPVIIRAN